MKADSLYREAQFNRRLNDDDYLNAQRDLMDKAEAIVSEDDD